MKCPKCGEKLKPQEKICTVCGYVNENIENTLELDSFVEEEQEEDNDLFSSESGFELGQNDNENNDLIEVINTQEENNINNNYQKPKKEKKITNFKDDRYIEAYIGEDYKWVMVRPINIYALLLSWVYFLYRKLYIIGIIGLIITGIVYRLYQEYLIIYIVIVMLSSSVLFNPIYKTVVKIRVNKIKKKYSDQDEFYIEDICRKKGGVSTIKALIIFFIFLVVMIRTYYSFHINTENTKFWEENSMNLANCKSLGKSAYKLYQDSNKTGTFEEAVCNVKTTKPISFDIYMKIRDNNQYKYVLFKNKNNILIAEGMDIDIETLQIKKQQYNLTQEEQEQLDKILEIQNNYKRIFEKSKEEEKLIKNKQNTSERTNYLLTKNDILQ